MARGIRARAGQLRQRPRVSELPATPTAELPLDVLGRQFSDAALDQAEIRSRQCVQLRAERIALPRRRRHRAIFEAVALLESRDRVSLSDLIAEFRSATKTRRHDDCSYRAPRGHSTRVARWSRPAWCSTTAAARPSAFTSNVSCASTILRK